jgi:hypothetical protein
MDPAYDPDRWHDFYVMSGGAAAALAGLIFVAMSLHSQAIRSHPLYGSRAVSSVVSLITQLILSAAVLVPGQTTLALGIEVEAAALYFFVRTATAIWRSRRHREAAPPTRRRQVFELLGASIWIVLFVSSGVSLMVRHGGGFYLLAIVMMFMFGWNVYVAWSLITEVSD